MSLCTNTDAIMMGMPNHVSLKSWEACRRVVAGRLINCYSRKDMILSLMFQLKRMQGILRPGKALHHDWKFTQSLD